MGYKKIFVRLSPALEKKYKPATVEKDSMGISQRIPDEGPQLVDPITGITIFQGNRDYDPVKGQEVPKTPFIAERIHLKQLIEVRDETPVVDKTPPIKKKKSGKE